MKLKQQNQINLLFFAIFVLVLVDSRSPVLCFFVFTEFLFAVSPIDLLGVLLISTVFPSFFLLRSDIVVNDSLITNCSFKRQKFAALILIKSSSHIFAKQVLTVKLLLNPYQTWTRSGWPRRREIICSMNSSGSSGRLIMSLNRANKIYC